MSDLQQNILCLVIGFIIGYLIKKSKFTVNVNFENDILKGVPKMQNKPEPPKK